MKHQIRPKYEILVSFPDKAVIHCSVLQVLSNDQLTQFQKKGSIKWSECGLSDKLDVADLDQLK